MKTHSIQRGAAALAIAMVLLFGMTLIAFFANRTLIFEQRASTNQYRATKAFELADAGVEWAIARLNDDLTLAANSCTPAVGTVASPLKSFRDRYFNPQPADAAHEVGWFNVVAGAMPGCQVNSSTGALTCACAAAGISTLAAAEQPRFRVQFIAQSDLTTVEILSRGCTNGDPCDPSQPVSAGTDSSSISRVLVKLRPTFVNSPNAGLISGSTTVISGSINVVNTQTPGNGITINTGSNVDLSGNGIKVVSLPGTPAAASILDNDPSLLKLTNADVSGELFFSSFLGEGFADFKSNPKTKVITAGAGNNAANLTCSNATDCGDAVKYWIEQGFSQFWVNPDVTLGSSSVPSTATTIGTPTKPIVLVTPQQLQTSGGITVYGVLYAASATAIDDLTMSGGGNSTIVGSLIARGDFARTGNGNLSVVYDASLFGGRTPQGILVPVPGSWRDKATAY